MRFRSIEYGVHLPQPYVPETFERDGLQLCLVSAPGFRNERFRWSALPYANLTFDESTLRVYVTHRGRKGVYFFRRYLSKLLVSWH